MLSDEKLKKLMPFSEYDQVPCPVVPVIAIPPITASRSASAMPRTKLSRTTVTGVITSVCPIAGNCGISTGASLMSVTTNSPVSATSLYAVKPPNRLASTRSPAAAPSVLSQAR